MIGQLVGRLDAVDEAGCILDVGGVGYLLACSARTLGRLQSGSGAQKVLVETHVREDAIILYGFATPDEREAFRTLLQVKTVGAQKALVVLSALSVPELARVIAAKDRKRLGEIRGLGPTTANRVVDEPAMQKWAVGRAVPDDSGDAGLEAALAPVGGAAADAVSALVNLGWKRPEALAAVGRAARRLGGDADLSALIRAGLQDAGR